MFYIFCTINRTRNSKPAHSRCEPGAALEMGKFVLRSTGDSLDTCYLSNLTFTINLMQINHVIVYTGVFPVNSGIKTVT